MKNEEVNQNEQVFFNGDDEVAGYSQSNGEEPRPLLFVDINLGEDQIERIIAAARARAEMASRLLQRL